MAEVYPMRAPGEYAGMYCEIKNCPNYARFSICPVGMNGSNRHLACGHHLPVVCKGTMYSTEHAVVVQEIPGNWLRNGNELAAIDGVITHVKTNRSVRQEAKVA